MGIIRRAIRVKLSSILKGTREKNQGREEKLLVQLLETKLDEGGNSVHDPILITNKDPPTRKKVLEIEYPIFKGQFSYMG